MRCIKKYKIRPTRIIESVDHRIIYKTKNIRSKRMYVYIGIANQYIHINVLDRT